MTRTHISHQGRRKREDREFSDAACTPKWLADLLPEVDFDPCSNPRSHIRSRWSWSLEKGYDGLKMPWRGSGFVNWPYSGPTPWAAKAAYEIDRGRCEQLITLCKLETSTTWWEIITEFDRASVHLARRHPPDLWLFNRRIQFEEHPELMLRRQNAIDSWIMGGKLGKRPPPAKSSNNFCSVIIHHRGRAAPLEMLHPYAQLWNRGAVRPDLAGIETDR